MHLYVHLAGHNVCSPVIAYSCWAGLENGSCKRTVKIKCLEISGCDQQSMHSKSAVKPKERR